MTTHPAALIPDLFNRVEGIAQFHDDGRVTFVDAEGREHVAGNPNEWPQLELDLDATKGFLDYDWQAGDYPGPKWTDASLVRLRAARAAGWVTTYHPDFES